MKRKLVIRFVRLEKAFVAQVLERDMNMDFAEIQRRQMHPYDEFPRFPLSSRMITLTHESDSERDDELEQMKNKISTEFFTHAYTPKKGERVHVRDLDTHEWKERTLFYILPERFRKHGAASFITEMTDADVSPYWIQMKGKDTPPIVKIVGSDNDFTATWQMDIPDEVSPTPTTEDNDEKPLFQIPKSDKKDEHLWVKVFFEGDAMNMCKLMDFAEAEEFFERVERVQDLQNEIGAGTPKKTPNTASIELMRDDHRTYKIKIVYAKTECGGEACHE